MRSKERLEELLELHIEALHITEAEYVQSVKDTIKELADEYYQVTGQHYKTKREVERKA
jgi:hypothetical protein